MIKSTYDCNEYQVIALTGPFDAKAVVDCRTALKQQTVNAEKGIVIEMSEVNFLDSSGIGAIVFMYKRLSLNSRSLHLVGLKDQPDRLIKLLRINQTIKTYTSITDFMAMPNL